VFQGPGNRLMNSVCMGPFPQGIYCGNSGEGWPDFFRLCYQVIPAKSMHWRQKAV
jgi:hypothetical protein